MNVIVYCVLVAAGMWYNCVRSRRHPQTEAVVWKPDMGAEALVLG